VYLLADIHKGAGKKRNAQRIRGGFFPTNG
jgi:hypothetical protein